jgi:hypothetical protein
MVNGRYEKTWEGLASYVNAHIEPHKTIMRQGFEAPDKGKFEFTRA